MAITRLDAISESKNKNDIHANLKACIKRICDPKKTENGYWIGGNAGLGVDSIIYTMLFNKSIWNKKDGRQGYHYMVSFAPEDIISADDVYWFASEFAEELLNDQYYYVTAVHTDTDKIHFHVIFDSVSNTTGKKYSSPKGDWAHRIQPITDRLCEKYHVSVLEYSWKPE